MFRSIRSNYLLLCLRDRRPTTTGSPIRILMLHIRPLHHLHLQLRASLSRGLRYSRMQLCQDDAHAWRSPNKHLENQVLRTRPPATQSGAFTPYNSRPNTAPQQAYRGVTPYSPQAGGRNQQTLYCNRFNRNEPCHERSCRYLHTCNLCGKSHPATACNVNVNGGNTGTSANAIPLPSRPPPRP